MEAAARAKAAEAEIRAAKLEAEREKLAAKLEATERAKGAALSKAAKVRFPHTGPHTTASAWSTPFLKDFFCPACLSAHTSLLSIPTHRDAFQLRF